MSHESVKFDWNSEAITVDNVSLYKIEQLMGELGLLRVSDFLPLLAEAGFPESLIQNQDIFRSVFSEFVPLYSKAMDELDLGIHYFRVNYSIPIIEAYELKGLDLREEYDRFDRIIKEMEFNVRWRAWQDILVMFADKVGEQVARELESWMYFHFFSDKFERAIHEWWIVLTQADTIPACLNEIEDLIDDMNRRNASIQFDMKVEQAFSDFYKQEDQKDSDSKLWFVAHPSTLEHMWLKNRTVPILQKIASHLDREDIDFVVEWATEISSHRLLGDPKSLCSSELITTKPLFSHIPSVFDTLARSEPTV